MSSSPFSVYFAIFMIVLASVLYPAYDSDEKAVAGDTNTQETSKRQAPGRGSSYADWPVYQGDTQHSGLSPYDTSDNTGRLKWKFALDGDGIAAPPVIGPDGVIYFGDTDGMFYAVYPDGELKWKYNISEKITQPAAVDSEGNVYVFTDMGIQLSNLYVLDKNGVLKWNMSVHITRCIPLVDDKGIFYTLDFDNDIGYHFSAYNPDGSLIWSLDAGFYTEGQVAIRNNVFYILDGRHLIAFTSSGILWSFDVESPTSPYSTICIGPDGVIYFTDGEYSLYAVSPDGELKWKYDGFYGIAESPSVSSDGTIYIGDTGTFYAFNPDGSIKWKYTYSSAWATMGPAVIDKNGIVYFLCGDDYLYSLNPDGTLRWKVRQTSIGHTSMAIDSEGSLYISDDGLYVRGLSVPDPPRGFSAVSGDGGIVLTWLAPLDDGGTDIVEFRIYRGESPGFENATLLTTVDADSTTYTDTTASAGITYYYYITAVNSKGESEPSIMANASIFTPPYDNTGGNGSSGGDTNSTSNSSGGMYLYAVAAVILVAIIVVVVILLLRKRREVKSDVKGLNTSATQSGIRERRSSSPPQPPPNHYQQNAYNPQPPYRPPTTPPQNYGDYGAQQYSNYTYSQQYRKY